MSKSKLCKRGKNIKDFLFSARLRFYLKSNKKKTRETCVRSYLTFDFSKYFCDASFLTFQFERDVLRIFFSQ